MLKPKNLNSLWGSILSELETEISAASFNVWFNKTKQDEVDNNNGKPVVKISCPSSFVKTTIESRFLSSIKKIGQRLLDNQPVDFVFTVSTNDKSINKKQSSLLNYTDQPYRKKHKAKPIRLNPNYTFDNFIIGPSNQVAVVAAQTIAKNPGSVYNPFFLFGGVGLGKTHLIQAIAHDITKHNHNLKLLYITSEEFTNDLVFAIRKQQMDKYKNKYRNADVLLVDDIQFIAGKTFVQEEFFHTFNSLYMNNKQVIVTADSPPDEISGLPQRIISRFKGGLTIDIQPLDYETRRGIVIQKVSFYKLNLDSQLVEILSSYPFDNVREIEGAILKISTFTKMSRKIDEDTIKSILGGEKQFHSKTNIKRIVKASAKYFDISIKDIKGKSRQSTIATARQVAMYLCRQELKLSYVMIGNYFGGKDHSTVIHSVEKIQNLFKTDSKIQKAILSIKGSLIG